MQHVGEALLKPKVLLQFLLKKKKCSQAFIHLVQGLVPYEGNKWAQQVVLTHYDTLENFPDFSQYFLIGKMVKWFVGLSASLDWISSSGR